MLQVGYKQSAVYCKVAVNPMLRTVIAYCDISWESKM